MSKLRILIFANEFDPAHDVMGFLPDWVRVLQRQGTDVRVMAQHVGKISRAVPLIDLDKYGRPGRIGRLVRTWTAMWRFRDQYDVLFVVMSPLWATVLSPLARLLGKRSYLWYAVWRGSWKLRCAERVVTGIFCSVPESFPFRSRKVRAIGQAIDIERYHPEEGQRISGRMLCLGRISPVKRIEVLLEALSIIPDLAEAHSVLIAGGPVSEGDRAYEADLRSRTARLGLEEAIVWLGKINHDATDELYRHADITVNMTPEGSFDKTMLEAMASGSIVVASNPALRRFLPPDVADRTMFRQDDSQDLANVLADLLALSDAEKGQLRIAMRTAVMQHHSIDQWARTIIAAMG